MRRSIPAFAAVLGLALTLTACGSDSDGGTAETTAPAGGEETTAPALTGTLTMWVDETRIDVMKPIVEQFQTETGVKVDLVQKVSGDIRTDFVSQVPTGEGPDVIIGAHDWTGEFVNNGVVAPIQLGDKAEEFSTSAVQAFTYDGQIYGAPYAIENIALVRNNAILPETKATTFDELVAEGKAAGKTYSVLIQQGDQGDAYHLYPLQTSFDAPIFTQDADGSYTSELGLGGENGDKFATYLQKLGQEKVLDPALGGDQVKEAFLAGESPYIVTGPWYTTEFTNAGLDISVLPVPSAGGSEAKPFVGVQGAFISAKSKNPVLANEFVTNFLTTEAVQTELYKAGGRLPALKTAAAKVDDPVLAGFNEAGATGAPMPSIPEMGAMWQFWGTTQVQIIGGQATDPAGAWNTMVTNMQGAIDSAS
ncbi:MAG: maltose ABC transporter substrate-binding protein [Cellulomonas sp.]|uniref:Sugar ABC transporter substrate-binding protein n=1 Tax=Cellulomonas gelida TaxID=1712 RepID=A0A4Y3KL43_9CELL|nr:MULTISPECIES: maltose ABC transporter substrate-binding protein [Cellulomonas]MCR6647854.1 maltose ABC transporter substrate-binding protein [Cellulomonas sp.]MCR6703791.1 maltose ABC transporter substrate-binding protein [Cellulomonas sp.]GEA83835.1 sugar ABC transporter substrate-binding protein [Cellulomonas gelida]GGL25684.1 sugar ABC transporter substrate-binding protein [Cellulomonas gelida]